MHICKLVILHVGGYAAYIFDNQIIYSYYINSTKLLTNVNTILTQLNYWN